MPRQVALLFAAVQFLTRLPVPALKDFQPDWTARSARYFSLVGALVGSGCAVVFVATSLIWDGVLPSMLALTTGVLMTGAFHEDGLADTLDGLGGGQTPARRLKIMKDSRIGTFGALGMGLAIALKTAALTELPVWIGALALVGGHAAGRAAAVVAMRALPYAGDRDWAKVKPVADGVTCGEVGIAAGFAVLALTPLLLSAPFATSLAVVGGGLLAAIMTLTARRLIGGWVGDTLGATEQMFELGFLLTLVAGLAQA